VPLKVSHWTAKRGATKNADGTWSLDALKKDKDGNDIPDYSIGAFQDVSDYPEWTNNITAGKWIIVKIPPAP